MIFLRTFILIGIVLSGGWIGSPSTAEAYPSFIGYGYKSCSTCHYNPLGNGPLTDYGRAVSATVIAARPFFVTQKTTDDQLGEQSGFFGSLVDLPSFIRPALAFRGMLLEKDLQSGGGSRLIPMQLDANLTLKALDDRLFAVMTFGYAPPPSNVPASQASNIPNLISRELYAAYRFSKAWGGLMN